MRRFSAPVTFFATSDALAATSNPGGSLDRPGRSGEIRFGADPACSSEHGSAGAGAGFRGHPTSGVQDSVTRRIWLVSSLVNSQEHKSIDAGLLEPGARVAAAAAFRQPTAQPGTLPLPFPSPKQRLVPADLPARRVRTRRTRRMRRSSTGFAAATARPSTSSTSATSSASTPSSTSGFATAGTRKRRRRKSSSISSRPWTDTGAMRPSQPGSSDSRAGRWPRGSGANGIRWSR